MLFSSSIAEQIDAFLKFKEGLGHKQSSYLSVLSQFDEFCVKQYPDMIAEYIGSQHHCVGKCPFHGHAVFIFHAIVHWEVVAEEYLDLPFSSSA